MTRKRAERDWIPLVAGGITGILAGIGTSSLAWAEQLAIAVTVGLVVVIALHVMFRSIHGKRRGP